MAASAALCVLLCLTGCEDRTEAEPEDVPRTAPPTRIEPPEPPFGGEVDPDGRTLRCPGRRLALTRPWWFVFSDRDNLDLNCPTGTSESVLRTVMVSEETGSCTVGWSGTLREGADYRFAGVGTQLNWADLSPYQAVILKTRGDGGRYRMELIDEAYTTDDEGCEDPDWDFHGTSFRCGDGTSDWLEVTVPFSGMKQEGWGTVRDLDLAQVDRLHIRTRVDAEGEFACDFWVAGVVLNNGDTLPFQ